MGDIQSGGDQDAFAWSQAGGFISLAISGQSTYAVGANFDGTSIAGNESDSNGSHAVYWTAANGWRAQSLGTFATGTESLANAISEDGSTVVGWGDTATSLTHAFVWNATDQVLQDINNNGVFTTSSATLVSADGSVVAGSGTVSSQTHGFRWTTADGMIDVGVLNGSNGTSLNGISRDGQVLIGTSLGGVAHAVRYVASSASLDDLGTLGGSYSSALGVNSDGSVVVGYSADNAGVDQGFRWTSAGGMTSVQQWLRAAGVDLGSDAPGVAEAVSADGNTVIGTSSSGNQYIARVVPDSSGNPGDSGSQPGSGGSEPGTGGSQPDTGSGIIETSEFLPTISQASTVMLRSGVQAADTVMFGAQGEPMRDRLSLGQMSLKGTIDGGRDSDAANDGFGLGQIEMGYGVAQGVTARFSLGGIKARDELGLDGDLRQTGVYLSPEVTADIGNDLYVTVGGYWLRSSIDSRRAYLNGVSSDYSDGSTDAETWGAKLRLDWLNAATIQNTEITPYAAISYARTTVDGYSETNGAFPVSYDDSGSHSTVVRLGADFVHPLNDRVRLLAKAEADYQFENKTGSTNGTIIGIGRFALPGKDLDQFWFRGGLGAEYDIGGGTGSLMANATTEGPEPDFWVRSDWGVKF
ncbi:autotransporter domain-containing protein [Neorhizobium sp. P12A]|uniref:autotransporter domain-containing protein n=1 Tax=Neorhizobium sp. P12A TaxID=2268027 RepID=UPI00165E1511|nr:autotransporter domain-containing protein [Neorhizobium sp. P12A]